MITINPIIPDELLPYKDIYATAWEVSSQPIFTIENYIVGRLALSITNTHSATFSIDESKLLSKHLFIRVQYKYTDGTISDFTEAFDFEIPDFLGFAYTSLIRVPNVSAYLEYINNEDGSVSGDLVIMSDAFKDYNTVTEHAYTNWSLIRDDGNVVFSKTAHFLLNPEDMYEVRIPISLLEDEVSYTINCNYIGKNDAVSGITSYKFQSFIRSNYFKVIIMSEFISGRVTYFRVEPKTTKYNKINFVLEDSYGEVMLQQLGQETVLPKFNIPSSLNANETYILKGYLTLTDGGETPLEEIAQFKIKESLLYNINNVVYPERVSKIGTLNSGINNTLSSIQLDDGIILIGNNTDRTINKYRLVDGVLTYIGVALTIDANENTGPLHLNIMKLYNGKLVVNYTYNTKFSKNNGNVFRLYSYNPANQEFTLLNQLRFDNMGNNTAHSSSMITSPQGSIYFIPSFQYDEVGERVPLYIYKINMATFTIESTIPLPFMAKQNVSLVPTKNINKFLLFGGSENRYEVDGQMTWKRENNELYFFDSSNDTISKLPIELMDEQGDYLIDPYIYSMQGYVRNDGKVVLFNSVIDGPKLADQDYYLFDTDTFEITRIYMDLPDQDIYKSTIRLNDGSFIRISTTYNTTNKIMYYPSAVGTAIFNPDAETYSGTLHVSVGETKYLTSVNFDKIIVEGTSPDNTGKLVLLIGGREFVYTYGTLVLGRTQTISVTERANFSTIVIVNGTDVKLLDTL